MNTIPLLDLTRQYLPLRTEMESVIHACCDAQRFILGPEVEGLEREIAEYCGAKFAIGVSSGTDALIVSLLALGIGPGDEVITSPFTFFASAGAIVRVGATPVFADIEPDTFNIDVSELERKTTPRTKAIMPVHLFGQGANMAAIVELAKRRSLPIVEDACQAIGTVIDTSVGSQKAGAIGELGCFSFFPSKNLGGFGDGGMVISNRKDLADRVRVLRTHGEVSRYHHEFVGGNFRLDALQAAVVRVKLNHLEQWTNARRKNADLYRNLFEQAGVVGRSAPASLSVADVPVILPIERGKGRHVFNQYVIRCRNRDGLAKHLQDQGIGTAVYYPRPLHLQECFASLGYSVGDFPVSEQAAIEVLALPIFPELTDSEISTVVGAVSAFYRTHG